MNSEDPSKDQQPQADPKPQDNQEENKDAKPEENKMVDESETSQANPSEEQEKKEEVQNESAPQQSEEPKNEGQQEQKPEESQAQPQEEQKKELTDQEKKDQEMAEQMQLNAELQDKQNEEIRKEIEDETPLVSDLLPIDMLEFEFSENVPFLSKVKNLKKDHPDYRKLRRDGSCFYRAFLFRFLEYVIRKNDKDLLKKFNDSIAESKKMLVEVGYEEFVIDSFQETLIEVLDEITKGVVNENKLLETFREKMKSDGMVMCMRLICSGYLRKNSILYEHFLEEGMTMEHFCLTEVEPIDSNTDQLQITALINFLEIPIKITYLDGSKKDVCDVIYIPEECEKDKVFINLLYRPGHYDLLYT